MTNEEITQELFTKNSELEKQNKKLDELVYETQHKLFGIQAVFTSLMDGSYNDRIKYDTFRSATGVALDSLDAVLNNINEVI